jgi:predicted permease
MSMFRRIANLFSRSKVDREIDAELRSHLEMRIEDNLADGMTPAEARRDALVRFGSPAATKERVASADAALQMERIWADLRYAVRQLRKSPVFTATAILTLALGIGATTAIFTVMNAVLLRSMPVPDPQRLIFLHVPDSQPYGAYNSGDGETSFSEPVFEVLRQDRRAFTDVMAFAPLSMTGKVAVRVGSESPEQDSVDMTSGNFFSGLGVEMARGRGFTADDERQNAPVAVLSYAYWSRRFARSPSVLGQTIYVKGSPFTVVGVAGDGFPGAEPGEFTDLWIPLQRDATFKPWGGASRFTLYGEPKWWCLRLIARLAPGVTIKQAVAEATPAFLAAAYAPIGEDDKQHPKIKLGAEAARGIQGLGDNHGEAYELLMALVTLVLAIACGNVAMLIVARNKARQRDFSLRMALGAQRGTLLRQLLIESCLLVVSGTVLGWLFALSAARALAAWSQLEVNLAPDRTILLFSVTVSVLAALIFSLAPLRTATNAPVIAALRATAATSYQRNRGGAAVLVLQVAMCFTLMTAAGLLLRTLLNYEQTNLGMKSQGLLVFGITPQAPTTSEAKFAFYRALLDRLRALPGVESVTYVGNRPGSGWSNNDDATVDGVTHPFEQVPLRTNTAGPDFLHVMGIPLLAGRDIEEKDSTASERVVIVNQTFVNKLMPNTNPIGHLLGDLKDRPYTIVGVAGDSKYRSVDEKPRAMAYYPYTQNDTAPPTIQVELRTAGDPLAVLVSAERAVHEMDANVPLEKPMTQTEAFEDSYSQQRLFARLAAFFGLLAALLVGIGLYGTLSYRISQRSSEIGVRMALGAQRRQVLGMVLGQSFRITAAGIGLGIPLALLAGHFMGSMLFGLQSWDEFTLLAALLGVAAVGLAAGYLPARRAASIDPMQALRSE